jgi:SdpI/YhfL family protein
MASVARRWLPPALIAGAVVASIMAAHRLPPMLSVDFGGLFPWPTPSSRLAPRWLALWLLPSVALLAWIGFRLAATIAGQHFGRKLFPTAPDEVTAPEQFDRFGNTYDTIVLAVVLLILGFQAGLLAAAVHANAAAARIIPLVLGGSLVLLGNVMPRLRPNWVAGLRSERLLADPQLWRRANRTFGTAIVASGIITVLAGIVAPSYGLLLGIAGVLVSCCIALIADGGHGNTTQRSLS